MFVNIKHFEGLSVRPASTILNWLKLEGSVYWSKCGIYVMTTFHVDCSVCTCLEFQRAWCKCTDWWKKKQKIYCLLLYKVSIFHGKLTWLWYSTDIKTKSIKGCHWFTIALTTTDNDNFVSCTCVMSIINSRIQYICMYMYRKNVALRSSGYVKQVCTIKPGILSFSVSCSYPIQWNFS